MTIIKPSTAFKAGADWVSAEVRAYIKDQVATHVDTVADVRDNDFEQTRFVYVRSKATLYRLDLSSGAADDGDTVLRDNVGRRYVKVLGSGGFVFWNAIAEDEAGLADYEDEDAGFAVLVIDVASSGRSAIYVMGDGGSGDWSDPAYLTGTAGQNGQNFEVDAIGAFTDRATYDDEPEGFAFLSTDGDGDETTSAVIFIKQSATAGDWSMPIPFQGPQGNPGDPVEMRKTSTHIQWKYASASTWANLVALDDLKGEKGDKGDTGPAWDGWQGEWVTSTAYEKLDTVERGGSSYICTSSHTSGSTTEPGVGADWQTVWDLVAAKGQDGAGTGDVVGPASSTDGEVALFDGATGKALKGGGALVATNVPTDPMGTFEGDSVEDVLDDHDGRLVDVEALASNAVQPEDLGTAAAADVGDFATAAQGAKADTALQPDEDADLAAGFTATSKSLGNLGSAVTISPAGGNIQHGINNAAVTITAPSVAGVYTIIVELVNSATAGAVTLAGFTKVDGDSFTTTDGDKFVLRIEKLNSVTTAYVSALQ